MAKAGTGALFAYNLEILANGPIDGRMVVDSVNDLTSAATWTTTDGKVYIYKGLRTFVKSENKIYALIDEDYTKADNWIKLIDEIELTEMSEDFDERITDVVDSLKGTEAGQVLITREDNSELKAKWEVPTSKDNLLFDGTFNADWPLKDKDLTNKATLLEVIETLVNKNWFTKGSTTLTLTGLTTLVEVGAPIKGTITITTKGNVDDNCTYTFTNSLADGGNLTTAEINNLNKKVAITRNVDTTIGSRTSKAISITLKGKDTDGIAYTATASSYTVNAYWKYKIWQSDTEVTTLNASDLDSMALCTSGTESFTWSASKALYYNLLLPSALTDATGSLTGDWMNTFGTAKNISITRNGITKSYKLYSVYVNPAPASLTINLKFGIN